MNTAASPSIYASQIRTPSRFSLILKRILNALAESRARSAARQLRRYEALIGNLSRRQDHSADFLMQSDDLPFKV